VKRDGKKQRKSKLNSEKIGKMGGGGDNGDKLL
jgi:hypothetical protein